MISLRRIVGPCISLWMVIAFLLTVQAISQQTVRWWPSWLQRDMGIWPHDGYKIAGGQLSEFLGEHPATSKPFGVILGASVGHIGIDTAELQARVQPQMPWIRLSVFGATTCEFEPVVALLKANELRPAVVVLAIEIKQLARDETFRDPRLDDRPQVDRQKLLDDLRRFKPVTLFNDIDNAIGNEFEKLFPDRERFRARLQNPRVGLRTHLLSRFGQNAASIFDRDWRRWSAYVDKIPDHVSEEYLDRQWQGTIARGVFDPRFYSTESEASQSLVRIMRQFLEMGAQVVTVVMPTVSKIRDNEPAKAMATLEQLFASSFGSDAPRLISLRDAVPDHLYYDLLHFGPEGKQLLTNKLIAELNGLPVKRRTISRTSSSHPSSSTQAKPAIQAHAGHTKPA